MEHRKKIIITDNIGNVISSDNQYSNYSFDFQYNAMAAAFNLTLVNINYDIRPGYQVLFSINDKIAFRGIIQRRERLTNKSANQVTLSGKDRSSILVENYCNDFKDFYNKKPMDIVESLIGQTNFYTKPKGSIDDTSDSTGFSNPDDVTDRNEAVLNDVDNSETLSDINDITIYDADFQALSNRKHYKINVGDVVFDKINTLVKATGYEILYAADGTLYIGDLNKKRFDDPIVYNIVFKKSGNGNNVLSARVSEDISGRYSTILISGQAEPREWSTASPYVNSFKVAKDSTLEDIKFYAASINDTETSPEKIAIQTREDQRIAGFNVGYDVPGHLADNGEIWKINRYVNVFDEINNIRRNLVLYGCTFMFNEGTGTRTTLRLSHERINELEI